jgi:23S rRNA (adenine2030-N6)-methyltransferase
VDPPFEEAGEFDRLVDGLAKSHRKFPGGVYALWYPLKDQRGVSGFVSALAATGIPSILRAEVAVRPASSPPALFGSGLIVVNPPYTLEDELRVLLPALAQVLGDARQGRHKLEWIRGEV